MNLTRANAEALCRIRDNGPAHWCKGKGRAGGAVSRMFERMAVAGLCTRAPHYITDAGRKAVQKFNDDLAARRDRNPNRVAWCAFCRQDHPGGATCMGHHP